VAILDALPALLPCLAQKVDIGTRLSAVSSWLKRFGGWEEIEALLPDWKTLLPICCCLSLAGKMTIVEEAMPTYPFEI